jgi:chromosome segregation ATPase
MPQAGELEMAWSEGSLSAWIGGAMLGWALCWLFDKFFLRDGQPAAREAARRLGKAAARLRRLRTQLASSRASAAALPGLQQANEDLRLELAAARDALRLRDEEANASRMHLNRLTRRLDELQGQALGKSV